MTQGIDFIYVPTADINEGISSRIIAKAALYFTNEYLFVLPFRSLQILSGGMDANFAQMKDFVDSINLKMPDSDTDSFNKRMFNTLKSSEIYHISELEKFDIQIGFWIFGGIHIKRKSLELQVFTVQPKALREKIKVFYSLV